MAAQSQPGWAHTWGLKNGTCHLVPPALMSNASALKLFSTMGSLEHFHTATDSAAQLVLSLTALAP